MSILAIYESWLLHGYLVSATESKYIMPGGDNKAWFNKHTMQHMHLLNSVGSGLNLNSRILSLPNCLAMESVVTVHMNAPNLFYRKPGVL